MPSFTNAVFVLINGWKLLVTLDFETINIEYSCDRLLLPDSSQSFTPSNLTTGLPFTTFVWYVGWFALVACIAGLLLVLESVQLETGSPSFSCNASALYHEFSPEIWLGSLAITNVPVPPAAKIGAGIDGGTIILPPETLLR